MSAAVVTVAAGAGAVGSGLVGGAFFAFSSFVMPALRRLPAPQGIAAMQSINRQAPTAAFMTLLFGTAMVAAGVGVHAAVHRDQPQAVWAGVGSISYLAAVALTGGFHVPRNDRLAQLDATVPDAAGHWAIYVAEWTVGNHVRTLACAAAALAFTEAVRTAG